jgi:homoserine dehydrogenase
MNPIRIGLLGAGVVASGVVKVLERNQAEIKRRAGRGIEVAKVGARNVEKARQALGGTMEITSDMDSVVTDPKIDIVVELIGGTG